MFDGCSDWEYVCDRVDCDVKEASSLPGVFSVTGFILLVFSIRSAECPAAVEKLCKPMVGKFRFVKPISDAGVCLAGELVGRLWCTEGTIEGNCFSRE